MMLAEIFMEKEKYRRRANITCGLWDAFKDFRKEYRLVHSNIKRKDYVNVCHLINMKLSDKIIKESFEFRMPYRLGTLSVKKTKVGVRVKNGKLEKNKMVVDWKKTWDMWLSEYPDLSRKEINQMKDKHVIYNMNEHTNGYIMGWVWDKNTCIVHNKSVYYFKPVKYNRLNLAKWIKSDERENDYYLNKKNYGRKKYRELRKSFTEKVKEAISDVE